MVKKGGKRLQSFPKMSSTIQKDLTKPSRLTQNDFLGDEIY